jgi:hypothetical protein
MGVRGWSEISSGFSGSVALDAAGGPSGAGMRLSRSFKVLFDNPADIQGSDLPGIVGVFIGDPHPIYPFCICDTFDFKQDSDSRLCWLVTANYSTTVASFESQSGQNNDDQPDPRQQEPEARKANWTTSTTTVEVPTWWWDVNGVAKPAVNPVGDIYDSVTMLQPIVNISVEQLVRGNPAFYAQHVGKVNSNTGIFAGITMFRHSVLFRGVTQKPHIERRRNRTWRGWSATFEFSYKPNWIGAPDENGVQMGYCGWDIVVPITGFNCINDGLNDPLVEKGALQLELVDDGLGIIKDWPANPALQAGTQGTKVRANVLISGAGFKASQRPSASPIPLNRNGTPRSSRLAVPVLLERASPYQEFDFSTLQLRFG